jgi:reactive intermediate/imine deaminase
MPEMIDSDKAPKAIGPYSQAVKVGQTVYLSGQIGLDPETLALVGPDVKSQAEQIMVNLRAVTAAAGGDLSSVVKLTVLLVDMADFSVVNAVMEAHWQPPFPARACFAVAALPKGARIEVEGVMAL